MLVIHKVARHVRHGRFVAIDYPRRSRRRAVVKTIGLRIPRRRRSRQR